MTKHISLQSLKTIDEQPRIRDLDLAEALDFSQARSIRKLIQRNLADLARYGEVFSAVEKNPRETETPCLGLAGNRDTMARTQGKRGPIGTEYWFNEGQALRICTLSNTDRAADITFEIINVFMAWRRQQLPPPPAAGGVAMGDGESVQLLYAKMAVIREGRILHGNHFAKSLWREMGLPSPLPGPEADTAADGRACLAHLMQSRLFDNDLRDDLRAFLHIVMSLEDEGAAARLAGHGVRCVFEGPQGILVANAGETLDRAFQGTRWAAMRWRYALRALPGSRAHETAQRFGGETHRSTFLPLALIAP